MCELYSVFLSLAHRLTVHDDRGNLFKAALKTCWTMFLKVVLDQTASSDSCWISAD
jgi:hypothetical protein